eukprot:scaffold2327_cov149-Amphora_coffeaeformis.AAC.3
MELDPGYSLFRIPFCVHNHKKSNSCHTMNKPFLRSPVRYPPRRGHQANPKDDYDNHARHDKSSWIFTPYFFGMCLLVLSFIALFLSPFDTKSSTDTTTRLGAGSSSISSAYSTLIKPSLHLLGERHTGTKWMTEHLTECFGDEIEIRKGFSAWKHWFQKDNPRITNAVVVAQFRNPYYWIEAMNRFPHHSPEHFDLDWKAFVTKPWTMKRYGPDALYEGSTAASTNVSIQCLVCPSLGPHEVIPCMANWTIIQEIPSETNGHRITDAFYELRHDGSGQPYDSILELRRDKIRNFLQVADFTSVKQMFAVQYDEMVTEGTDLLVSYLEAALGVKAKCVPYHGKGSPKKPLDAEFIEYMREHIDWDTEALIGFTPRDV